MKKSTIKPFLIGGAILGAFYYLSRIVSPTSQASSSTSTATNVRKTIVNLLTKNGYSARLAENWFLISNMETANFTSNLYKNYFNLWGMKQPQKRMTKSMGGTSNGWATYANLDDAVLDIIFYMEELNYPNEFKSLDQQLIFMKEKGYFEEPLEQYRDLVIAWKNKFNY